MGAVVGTGLGAGRGEIPAASAGVTDLFRAGVTEMGVRVWWGLGRAGVAEVGVRVWRGWRARV